jgi:hypothetical protein
MGRHLLSSKYPNAGFEFGPGFLENRPVACALIAQIVALGSELDFQFARLFAALMGADTERTIAVFVAIRNARLQRNVLAAAAKSALQSPTEIEMFNAYVEVARSLENERNALAHGLLGRTDLLPDAVLCVSVEERVKLMLVMREPPSERQRAAVGALEVYLYEIADLEQTRADILNFHGLLYDFVSLVSRQPSPSRDELCESIAARSPIREELEAQRMRAKRSRS